MNAIPLSVKIVNKYLLMRYKVKPEMHLKQPGFSYSACGRFTKKTKKELESYADWKYKFYLQK